ncbi:hypothetical protein VD659_14720 [Herbiconiux sp. 11R-BC]|uniref:hypothetical protein n=1 Tax=Herbiconiux sp. 11R-BC TaxID=3111637 RepID=UPI003C0B1407
MSEVWCIVSDDDVAARTLAGALLEQHDQVAVITRDAAPFALLVNVYGDGILTAEMRDTELLSLTDALWTIEESFGPVDVIALVAGPAVPGRAALSGTGQTPAEPPMAGAEAYFGARWPLAEVVRVTHVDEARAAHAAHDARRAPLDR